MFILSFFGPCEVVRSFIWGKDGINHWDCADRTSPMSLVIYLALLLGGTLTVYFTMFHGETEAAKTRRAKVSRWAKSLKTRSGPHELKAWEVALFGSAIGLVLVGVGLYADGPSFGGLLIALLCGVALAFMFWLAAHKEHEDPHKDIPGDVRAKTNEELKEYNERLALLNQARNLRGDPGINLFDHAKTLHELYEQKRAVTKEYPHLKEKLELMAEVQEHRIMEKNK